MTIQYNFFASEKDELLLLEMLIETLPGIYAFPERGKSDDMKPRAIKTIHDLAGGKKVYLVTDDLINDVVIERIEDDIYWLDFRECPVLEYIPSKTVSKNTLKIGRFAYFYHDAVPFRKKVEKLFRKLKKNSNKLKNKNCWIFEEADKKDILLQFWVGRPDSKSETS